MNPTQKNLTTDQILNGTCRKECPYVRKYGYQDAACNFCRECALVAKYYEEQE